MDLFITKDLHLPTAHKTCCRIFDQYSCKPLYDWKLIVE